MLGDDYSGSIFDGLNFLPWQRNQLLAWWPWLVKRTWPDGHVTVVMMCRDQIEAQFQADYYTGLNQKGTFWVEKYDPKSPTNDWGEF